MSEHIINIGNSGDLTDIFAALEYASYLHRYQKRKGAFSIPYINHPIEVTSFLLKHTTSPGKNLLIAAILHDTLEDTRAKPEDLLEKFGPHVLKLVTEVSDDMRLSATTRKRLQVEHAMELSDEARAIKIADKACNIRDILFTRIKWTKARKIRYIIWAKRVVDQIGKTHPKLYHEFGVIINQAEKILNHPFTIS